MTNKKKTGIRVSHYLLLALCLALGLLLYVIVSASSSTPLVKEVEQLDAESAHKAKVMAKRLHKQLLYSVEQAQFRASIEELNGLAALASRGVPRFKGRVNVSQWAIAVAVTLNLPENPFGQYVNLHFGVEPSDYGLQLSEVRIGSLRLPGSMARRIVETALNILLGDKQGSSMLSAVKSVKVDGQMIRVYIQSIPDLKNGMRNLSTRLSDARVGDPALIRLYYAKLCKVGEQIDGIRHLPVSVFVQPVFELAYQRSQSIEQTQEENQAALIALGLYLGSGRFEKFVGKVRTGDLSMCRGEPRSSEFAGRHDLVLHFFYSVMIKILTDTGISMAMGEFKELLDLNKQRGGASFSDLAADMAGIRFAQRLLAPGNEAWRAQRMLAEDADEQNYFPDIAGLPDELPKVEFEAVYGGVDDPRYQDMVRLLQRRIDRLPLYAN